MKYFKDSVTNQPCELDDTVVAIKQLDGTFKFETQETIQVPALIVRRAAVVINHAQVIANDGVTVEMTGYDEIVTDAHDEELVAAHSETRSVQPMSLPATLVPISQAEFEAIEAANAAQRQAAIEAAQRPQKFIDDIKVALGIVDAQAFFNSVSLFQGEVLAQNWSNVQALILDAKTNHVITTAEYGLIKTAASTNNIPITLA